MPVIELADSVEVFVAVVPPPPPPQPTRRQRINKVTRALVML
jgi:hypothetical protein